MGTVAWEWTEVLAFLFDGGSTGKPAAELTLKAEEIRTARFVSLRDAEQLMGPPEFARIAAGIASRTGKATAYLENGHLPA